MTWETKKLGKFIAFVPKVSHDDILLRVFALAGFKKGSTFRASSSDIYAFFKKEKEKHPEVFDTIFFNNDPDFPYSEQLGDALASLLVDEILIPSFDAICELRSNLNHFRLAKYEDKDVYQEVADAFLKEFDCTHPEEHNNV